MTRHPNQATLPGKPRSLGCATRSLEAELARVKAMTVEERIRSALALKTKLAGLKPVQVRAIHG